MDHVFAGPWVSLSAIAVVALSAIGFCRAGSMLLSWIAPKPPVFKSLEWAVFSAGLGAAAFCMAVYGLGLAGLLSRPILWMLLAAFVVAPYIIARLQRQKPCAEPFAWGGCPKPFHLLVYGAMAAALVLAAIQALAPASGMDSLAYHLYLPKEFLAQGRMAFLPLTRESLWPLLSEMYFLFALALQGTAAAQLFHWLFYGLTAALIYALARRFYDKGSAVWASTIFLFTPVHFAQAGYAYVDLALAFYVLAAVYVFLLAEAEGEGRLVFLSGLFAGAAAATKYLGLDTCLILLAFVLVRFKANPVRALQFLGGCAVIGAAWYLRSWVVAGNPFFPLYAGLFNGNGYEVDIAAGVGMGTGIVDFLRFPWNLSMYPANFGGQMFGPLYLLFALPAIFAARSLRRPSRWLFFFAVIYCFFLFKQSQQARFYVSVAPFAAIAAGWCLQHFYLARARWLRRLTVAVLAAVMLFHGAVFAYRVREKWKPVFGVERAEKYLSEHERSFKGWEWLHRHATPGQIIINAAEVRYFYAPPTLHVRHLTQEVVRLRWEGVDVADYLRAQRPDWIWVVQDSPSEVMEYIRRGPYELAFTYRFAEKPAVFENRIYRRRP